MSTYTIDNKNFNLVNPLSADDIRDENYEHVLKLIDRFKKSPEYKGQTIDELFDIVLAKYREDTIEYIADERTKSYFNDQRNNYSHKLHDELSKMSKAYFADFENQHKQANIKVAEKWGLKSAKQLNDNVFEYLLGETLLHDEEGLEYLKNFANKRSFNSEDFEKYPALVGNEHMISELQEKANAIIEYCEEYGFVDVTAEDYAREKMPKDFEKEVFQKSEVYLNTQKLLKQEKKEYYNNEKVELQQTFKSSLSGTKDLYLNAKTQLKNILQARDDLANRYYKTSLLSRVARWIPFISRESSEAGRLQNEIDKIDNAIKEVGIDNELVNAVKAEMKAEKLAIKKEVENNEKEVVSVAETLNLQENIKDATVNKGVSNNRKIEENKELNQEKVIHNNNNELNNKLQK